MDHDVLSASHLTLLNNSTIRSNEPAAKGSCCNGTYLRWKLDQVGVCKTDRYIFGKRPPVGKTWLKLVVANLVIARVALATSSTATNEGYRDPVTNLKVAYLLPNGGHCAG
jgi:hypothetical protein